MADNKTPPLPPAAETEVSEDELWLVSYADDDDRELTAHQIAAALERGEIDANTIVWRDGMPEWKAIAEVAVLRAQLRRVSNAPENLRRRQTVLGGFGPAVPQAISGGATPAPAPGFSLDDDEPTVIQTMSEGFSSAPNHVRPDPSSQRSRHPTSGNTLRIKTGEPPPVTPRELAHDRVTPSDPSRAVKFALESSPGAVPPPDSDLESLPSALLVTATEAVEVRKSGAPVAPTRGVMSRQSDPPGTPLGSNIPRAALTRDPDSDMPPAPKRITDAPKPPVPRSKRSPDEPESLPSDAVTSVVSTAGVEPPSARKPTEADNLPSIQVREDYNESDISRRRTRPPRNRREGLAESGTPPPLGELQEAAARVAHATSSHAPPQLSQPAPTPASNGRWLGLAVLAIAAVAGAFALGKRSGGGTDAVPERPITLAPTPSVSPTTAVQAATLAAATASVAPSGGAASSEAEAEVAQAAEVPATPKTPVQPPSPQVNAKPEPAHAVVASPKPEPKPASKALAATTSASDVSPSPAAASATPAPAAESVAGAFDASAAANALAKAASQASACRQPGDPSGVARVTVTFANSGHATHALVDGPPFSGTPTGGCIASTMRGAVVPAFTGDRVTVKKTVVIQ